MHTGSVAVLLQAGKLTLMSTFFQRSARYRGWEKGEQEEQMGSEEVKLGCGFLWRRKRRSRARCCLPEDFHGVVVLHGFSNTFPSL